MATPDARSPVENFDAARAAAASVGWRFEHVESTGSTNTDLADAARAGEREPKVLVADHQTAGRGRLDRRWTDEPGHQLLVSMRVPGAADAQAVPGAMAVASHRVVADLGCPAGIKWPNDLVVEGGPAPGKLAGMLSEFVAGDDPVIVTGLGLNVGSAPSERATSLAANGCDTSRDDVLAAIVVELAALLVEPGTVHEQLIERSATLGRRVRVERRDADLVGIAVGLGADGALLVEVDGATVPVSIGDVVHLRPVD